MESFIRIGDRLFNLVHVISIEPSEDGGENAMDVFLVPGRFVRLKGDDAKAAQFFVASYPACPIDQAAQDRTDREEQGAQDRATLRLDDWQAGVDEAGS